jgi:hypothetical protein
MVTATPPPALPAPLGGLVGQRRFGARAGCKRLVERPHDLELDSTLQATELDDIGGRALHGC